MKINPSAPEGAAPADNAGLPPFLGATLDSRKVRPGMAFVALKGEKCDGHDFIPQAFQSGAAFAIESEEELAEVALAYRRSLKAKVVGVTGSAGKTTTKEMLRAFLATAGRVHATPGNLNNHLGLPLTILDCPQDADFLVLEMGTNHPGEIAHLCNIAEPDCGAIASIGTAHIEFFGTREAIAREKGALLASAKDFGAVPEGCAELATLRSLCRGEFVVSPSNQEWVREALDGVLPGEHSVSNACLAFATAERLGAKRENAAAALRNLRLPGARWNRQEIGGVIYIDDSYNANPDSMKAALSAFAALPCAGRRIAILGDMFELGESTEKLHAGVFTFAESLGLDFIAGVGPVSSALARDAAFATAEALAEALPKLAKPGDAVLLKASHGMRLSSALPRC